MNVRGRVAAICGVLMMAVLSACSNSPTEPSGFPLAVEMVTGQTLTVPGTDLRLTLEPLAPCPPNASCLAGPRARLTARAGTGAPVDVFLAYPFEGLPTPQRVDGYTVALRYFDEDAAGVVRVYLTVDRTGTR
jgi:hypothetical protein